MKIANTLLLLAAAFALSGCVVAIGNDAFEHDEDDWEQRQERNDRYIRELDLGASTGLIEADLGQPDIRETFQRNGEVYEVLYYRTQHKKSDGETSRNEATPLVFVNQRLVGYGESAIEHATE